MPYFTKFAHEPLFGDFCTDLDIWVPGSPFYAWLGEVMRQKEMRE
jgi:hypothetical protein